MDTQLLAELMKARINAFVRSLPPQMVAVWRHNFPPDLGWEPQLDMFLEGKIQEELPPQGNSRDEFVRDAASEFMSNLLFESPGVGPEAITAGLTLTREFGSLFRDWSRQTS